VRTDDSIAGFLRIERRPVTPARRKPYAGREGDVVRRVSGWIKKDLIPLQILDAIGDRCALPQFFAGTGDSSSKSNTTAFTPRERRGAA